jgi:phosphoribosyl 1,2-cyclic phosphodiesterase
MSATPVFTITYWGVTGTMSASLRPTEVTDKIVAALRGLLAGGHLKALGDGSDEAAVRACVEAHLPFQLRSTWGANTTCVEVQAPDELLILDCGTGFRELGIEIVRRWGVPGYSRQRTAHVFISHPHMDHTCATAFFEPYLDPRNHFSVYGTASVLRSLEAVLKPSSDLANLYFPPTFDILKALRGWQTIEPGAALKIGTTHVRTFALKHPGGCLAFRLDNAARSYVFATDHEHPEVPDRALADFARNADVLYIDGQYLEAEYLGKEGIMGQRPLSTKGWGHSSVEACVATAVAAGVKELHLGHREPKRDDADLLRVERFMQERMRQELHAAGRPPNSCRACIPYEGLTVRL